MFRHFACLFLIGTMLLAQAPADCPNYNTQRTEFDDYVKLNIDSGKLHGVGLAVVTADGFDFIKGYGNKVGTQPITIDTIFRLASVSKTITSTALIMASQQGYVDYNAGLNTQNIGQAASSPCKSVDCILSWRFFNPNFQDTDISPRQVNSFFGSINDNDAILNAFFNDRTALEDFLSGYLLPAGNYYTTVGNAPTPQNPDNSASWAEHEAGCIYIYSNVTAAMSAYITQRATGWDFPSWCQKELFTPLVMRSTTWFPDSYDNSQKARIATAYSYKNGQYQPAEKTDPFPYYPAGGLFSSLGDMAKFTRMIFNDGRENNEQFLRHGTVASLGMQSNLPTCGLRTGDMWFRLKGNLNLLMKLGSSYGVSTLMVIDTKNKLAYLAFANGRDEDDEMNSVNALGRIVTCMMATAAPDSVKGLNGNVAKTCDTVIVTSQTPQTNCSTSSDSD